MACLQPPARAGGAGSDSRLTSTIGPQVKKLKAEKAWLEAQVSRPPQVVSPVAPVQRLTRRVSI